MIFRDGRIMDFIVLLVTCVSVYYWIRLAKKGDKSVSIRSLAAMDAIDEVIGAAAERGRKVLFVPQGNIMGGGTAPQVIAALSILPRVAMRAAEYGAKLQVAYAAVTIGPLILENMKQGFLMAGKEEELGPDSVIFFPSYTYTLGTMALIGEEGNEPGAVFHLGAYYHETIIYGESGQRAGALQIGGTAMTVQLPFMIATMDYVLLGEELYAAGAYISEDPVLLGSIRGQDWSKVYAIIFIILTFLSATIGISAFQSLIGM
jgi:hypothetical protein